MTDLNTRINAFVKLGTFFRQFTYPNYALNDEGEINSRFFKLLETQIESAESHNGWFTRENICFSLGRWSEVLTCEKLTGWLSAYSPEHNTSKKVAVIMAGNIPLVGFHDFLSVLICGHTALVKLSSNDNRLLPVIASYLEEIEPGFKGKIIFTDNIIKGFDAVIATGSNNTARYFEYYFKGVPGIIRKNRNSIAVLTGNESDYQLKELGEDIFRYFGLGCRSVSKLFVPEAYDFDKLYKAFYSYHPIIDLKKYANNYDYNKAVYLMSQFKILDNGFLMFKEDSSYASPIASVFYEYYTDLSEVKHRLKEDAEQLQCVVAHGVWENEVPFGKTQFPELREYADGIDTVEFLLKI